MNLDYIPLLHKQRELQSMPRGWERFRAYLSTVVGEGDDIVAPLVAMNPMGKEHVSALLDELLAIDGDAVGERAAHEAAARLPGVDGSYRISLVVVDDAQGGWTNRYASEMGFRFGELAPAGSKWLKQQWIGVPLWSGDRHTTDSIRRETLAAIVRTALKARHGAPTTLRAMLGQEGLAYAFAGLTVSWLDAEELAYAQEVIAPHLDTTAYPPVFACIWGDEAAAAFGYAALGLAPSAGLIVAAHAAQRRLSELDLTPEQALALDPSGII